jgi:hypothetical protein
VIDAGAGAALAVGRAARARRQSHIATVAGVAADCGPVDDRCAARSGGIDGVGTVGHTSRATATSCATAAPVGSRRVGLGAAVMRVDHHRTREIHAA